jgi:hypothetical protein
MKRTSTRKLRPGEVWLDTDGSPIQAHGGGILYHDGVYYWYGENKAGPTLAAPLVQYRVDVIGISCYSSRDLVNWKNEGIVLPAVPGDASHDLHPSKVLERPKVLHHAPSGRFIMWMHVDSPNYSLARVGVATGPSPTGPFQYRGSFRPNGQESRDMTVFKDDDGAAYLFYSSQKNATMHITRLTDDYLGCREGHSIAFENLRREAPAVFKRGGRYYIITSGCSGWAPNPAMWSWAHSPTGPWHSQDNPCKGEAGAKTYDGQCTFVLPVAGGDRLIFMADRWRADNLGDSRYIWLPLEFQNEQIVVRWLDEWEL